MEICTWRINTLYEPDKVHNVIQEVERFETDIQWKNNT